MNPENTDNHDIDETTPAYGPLTESSITPQSEPTTSSASVSHAPADDSDAIAANTLPTPPTAATNATKPQPTTPSLVILQWLTYAFWGWTILALLALIGMAASYSFQPSLSDAAPEPVAYGVAAVFVLLPISFICDIFYSRREAAHKRGVAMVIMVIHAVVFALLAIAALITIAFSVVSLLLGTGNVNGPLTVTIVGAAAVVLYALTLLRTARPFSFAKYRLLFRILMLLAAIGVATWAIVGPVAQAARTKDDRSVRSAMQVINSQIDAYANKNNVLPDSIKTALNTDLNYSYEGEISKSTIDDLANRQLITYTRDQTPVVKSPSLDQTYDPTMTTLYYTLCATYRYAQTNPYPNGGNSSIEADGYSSFYSSYDGAHAGKNCYKLKTIAYKTSVNTSEILLHGGRATSTSLN